MVPAEQEGHQQSKMMQKGIKKSKLARMDFLGGTVDKNLPAIQETWIRSLGQEDPLEKGMATHSSILAWRIP